MKISVIMGSSECYRWVPAVALGELPPLAVHAGHESDGAKIYVGRIDYEGGAVPVKVSHSKRMATFFGDGKERFCKNFEVLCGEGFEWIVTEGNAVPSKAVLYGRSNRDSPVYVGRTAHKGALVLGRVDLIRNCLLALYNGEEIACYDFEYLINRQKKDESIIECTWERATNTGPVPQNAVCAGYDTDNSRIYVGRVNHEGNVIPAKVIPGSSAVHSLHNGTRISKETCEVLCGNNVSWVTFRGEIPAEAVQCGTLASGETVYIGRARFHNTQTPGKVLASTKFLEIPWESHGQIFRRFEILVHGQHGKTEIDIGRVDEDQMFGSIAQPTENLTRRHRWVPCRNCLPPPDGAVVAGYGADGNTIYVGRVWYQGNLLPAKVIPAVHLCHSQYNGGELEMISYEALCYGNLSWVRFDGNIPSNAVICGHTLSGETVYIGRGKYVGSLTPGMVLASSKVLRIPSCWKEIKIKNFEILVDLSASEVYEGCPIRWVHTKREQVPPREAVVAGHDTDGSVIYVGRVEHDGNCYVAKAVPSKKICDATHNGSVVSKYCHAALCNSKVSWTRFNGRIPRNAVECGRTRNGEMVFIGRAKLESALIPGSVLESEKKLRIVHQGEEVVCEEFEILVLPFNDDTDDELEQDLASPSSDSSEFDW